MVITRTSPYDHASPSFRVDQYIGRAKYFLFMLHSDCNHLTFKTTSTCVSEVEPVVEGKLCRFTCAYIYLLIITRCVCAAGTRCWWNIWCKTTTTIRAMRFTWQMHVHTQVRRNHTPHMWDSWWWASDERTSDTELQPKYNRSTWL